MSHGVLTTTDESGYGRYVPTQKPVLYYSLERHDVLTRVLNPVRRTHVQEFQGVPETSLFRCETPGSEVGGSRSSTPVGKWEKKGTKVLLGPWSRRGSYPLLYVVAPPRYETPGVMGVVVEIPRSGPQTQPHS